MVDRTKMAAAITQGASASTKRRRVPAADRMDDETFFKHYNARHLADVGLATPMHYHRTLTRSLIATFRAYHERWHSLNEAPDHVHNEE